MSLPLLYMHFHPDGDMHPGRYTEGFWIRALKFSPPPHLPSFLFGMVLADLDGRIARAGRLRLALGLLGVGGVYLLLCFGAHIPYVLMHDGLLMPLFGVRDPWARRQQSAGELFRLCALCRARPGQLLPLHPPLQSLDADPQLRPA